MPAPPALQCEHIFKRFGVMRALDGASLSAFPGECVALFGRNGAGKSTLLGVASGLIRSFTGTVYRFGNSLSDRDADTRKRVGFVSHDTFLYGDLTAADNLRFFARLYDVSDAAVRVAELLERFELASRGTTPTRALSRGLQQRLSLARAVIHRPDLLLLDEPFTGLDESAALLLTAMVNDFTAAGGAAVITTHDMERGLGVAHRVAIMERGRIVWESGSSVDGAAVRQAYRNVLSGEVAS